MSSHSQFESNSLSRTNKENRLNDCQTNSCENNCKPINKKSNEMISNTITRKDIISLSINEEHNLFAASMESGVRLFNIEPLIVKANLSTRQTSDRLPFANSYIEPI